MDLNPLKWIVKPIAGAVGAWQERKAQAKEVEGRIKEARIGVKLAKLNAKAERYRIRTQADSSYDMQVLKNRQHTWVDEFIVVAIVLMTVLAFIPATHPYVEAGWKAVSEAPFWFQFAWITMIASTLGGLTILRIMMGRSAQRVVDRTTPPEGRKKKPEQNESTPANGTRGPSNSNSPRTSPKGPSDSSGYPFEDRPRR